MLKGGVQANTNASADQVIASAAARRSANGNNACSRGRGSEEEKGRSRLPAIITVVGAVALFAWWRKSQKKDSNGEAGNSSAQSRQARARGRIGRLPRNASSNNKKNKERRRNERDRRAEKRDKEPSSAGPSASGRGGGEGDNSIILTSTFVDPHKSSTTNIPKVQKREGVKNNGSVESSKGSELDPAFARELRRKS